MIGDHHNPFDELGLPPTSGPEELTEALRARLEDAPPEEHAALRASWERLMRHPRDRLFLALGAHPGSAPAVRALPTLRPDGEAIAAVAAHETPPDELLPLPLASAAVPRPLEPDPLAALAAQLGEET